MAETTLTLPERCLTVAQVAARAGVGRNTVCEWIRRGVLVAGRRVKLQAVRLGGSWRVAEEWWARFIAEQNGGARVELAEQQTRRRRAAEEAQRRARELVGLPKV